MEQFTSVQYTAAIIADNWGGHFSKCISDLQQNVLDLELVRYGEIQDERNNHVATLETAAEAYEAWRLRIERSIFTVHSEVDRLSKLWDRSIIALAIGSLGSMCSPELVVGHASNGLSTG